jgi:hypothetical protein
VSRWMPVMRSVLRMLPGRALLPLQSLRAMYAELTAYSVSAGLVALKPVAGADGPCGV